ncbi:hydroxymethylpyrimidine permease [Spirochaetia bacterium]|nr:hydroxymethylpyrimidine permease [Spirochaetia bacterium]
MKKSTMFLLWVGAAISISEIYTGGLLAPLGFGAGIAAIIAGHLIGAGLLALGAFISYNGKVNAMDSVSLRLGSGGGKIVALLNIIQLIGWTIVMIVQASAAVTAILPKLNFMILSLVLGVIVLVWALIFGTPAQWVNSVIVTLLALLCAILFAENASQAAALPGTALPLPPLSFALALELSIAMPVSWLPLVGDYSYNADGKICAAVMPFVGYFLGSVLMYGIGLYITIHSGGDFFSLIAASRFRLIACAVVVFSTVTTGFLDLYSAAVSTRQFIKTKSPRAALLIIGITAAVVSAIFPFDKYGDFLTAFLTTIGMIFVPVYSYLFISFFLKEKTGNHTAVNIKGLIIICAGIISYKLCAINEFFVPTLISIAVVCILFLLSRR